MTFRHSFFSLLGSPFLISRASSPQNGLGDMPHAINPFCSQRQSKSVSSNFCYTHRTKQGVPRRSVKSTLMTIQAIYFYLILTQCWFLTPTPTIQIFNTIVTQIMALWVCTPYIIVSFIPVFRRNLLSPSSV
jgi:hypothetical protein